MELRNFYRLMFTNSQEFFVESDITETETFLKKLTVGSFAGVFTSGNGYISLQRTEESDPLNIKSDKLFSVQKAGSGMIGAQTKLWRLV